MIDSGARIEDQSTSSWKPALWHSVILRVGYSLFAAAVALIQPVNWRLMHSNALTENLPAPDHSLRYVLIGVWERFDTLWYLHIAARGYDRPEAAVFFPVYPGLIKVVSLVVPPTAAALLISSFASFFAFWGLLELLRADYPPQAAKRAVILCAVWPGSFVFFAGYPESLLLALIAWALYMIRRDRWQAAVALGAAAALTKAAGVLVFVPLAIIALQGGAASRGVAPGAAAWRRFSIATAILLIPLTSAAYTEYLRWTGHASLSSVYAHYWRTSAAPPWVTLWNAVSTMVHAPTALFGINLAMLIFVCVLLFASRARVEYLAYSAAAIGLVLCKETTPPLQSLIRYMLIVFPAFAGLACLLEGSRSRFALVCACLLAVNLGLLWLFTGWSLVL